jgi:hypothetical protein
VCKSLYCLFKKTLFNKNIVEFCARLFCNLPLSILLRNIVFPQTYADTSQKSNRWWFFQDGGNGRRDGAEREHEQMRGIVGTPQAQNEANLPNLLSKWTFKNVGVLIIGCKFLQDFCNNLFCFFLSAVFNEFIKLVIVLYLFIFIFYLLD